jgi:hypothetical protein
MGINMKLIFVVIIFSASLLAQDDSILQLFPGKWIMDTNKAEIYEEWIVSGETELTGKSFSIEAGDEYVSEILYLKKFGEQWAYVAVPEGQSITLFALVEYTPKKFIFENKEHDFPQRIIYEFHKDGKLTAAIEGTVNGENKRKEFSFRLVE